MSNRSLIFCSFILMTVSFLAGTWFTNHSAKQSGKSGARKILHYVDPMHPSYTSDKQGIAPDCGMQLEPVYADGTVGGGSQIPPGTVRVRAEQLQTIGVKVASVEQSSGTQYLRVPGRIAPDERKVYRLTASVTGWVQSIGNATTGDIVKKNETLLSFYAPDFLAAIQSYIYALGSIDRTMAAQGQKMPSQLDANNLNLHNYRYTLRNLGMSDRQIDEITNSREPTENIRVLAPADGFVLTRNVFPGLKFEGGTEFFRIADLSKVWVLADTYGSEADHLKPGTIVKVSLPNRNRVYSAKVSSVPPIFDSASRTLKVRLEVDNPGYILRPDMFVDVELPVQIPSMLSVPSEALLDTGLRKTVYVERGQGVFEPREVMTGRNFGNRVEILSGLKEGERIAISGTFLLDSESRMKSAASGISGTPRQDPVCGMYLDEAKSRSKGLVIESGGKEDFFCSDDCKGKYKKRPAAKSSADTAKTKVKAIIPVKTEEMEHSNHPSHDNKKAPPLPSGQTDHSGHDMQGGMK